MNIDDLKLDDEIEVSIAPVSDGGSITTYFADKSKNGKVLAWQKSMKSTETAITVEWDYWEKVGL